MSSWPDFAVSKIREFAGFTVSKAGESFVENVVSTAYSHLCDRIRPADTEAEIKRLQTALPQITAVIGIAHALKIKDPTTSLLADQFTHAAQASQDVLNQLEKEAGGSASTSNKRKSCHINNDTFKKLKLAVEMSDRATDDIELLLRHATIQGIHGHSESQKKVGQVLCRESTSFLTEREVFGREVEKKKIIDWLERPTETRLSSFGIVGVGGQGKTTLLQFVYQQIIKENNFEKTIWVWVSNNFSVQQVTRKMIGDTSSCGKSLNTLQENLKEMIIYKKVLLILDDVGDNNRKGDWEQLFAPLIRFVEPGSKILFTTRMKCVADLLASTVINTEYESLELQGLEEQDLRHLFYSYAFRGFNRDNHKDLEEFANPKLRLLRGSPLAAKVIGNLLNSNMDNQHWRKILNHESLVNLEQADDIGKDFSIFETQIRR